jgi:hypothetical protein
MQGTGTSAKCEQLESLILMYCRDTTDAATEHITGLRKLSYYFNSSTTITDRTPELLSGMDSLERITFDTCHGLTNARLLGSRGCHDGASCVSQESESRLMWSMRFLRESACSASRKGRLRR